jgi:hypothetical protein
MRSLGIIFLNFQESIHYLFENKNKVSLKTKNQKQKIEQKQNFCIKQVKK